MQEVRIYSVAANGGGTVFVKAANQAQALRHVARNTYSVSVASSVAVADHMTNGGKIFDATGPQQELSIGG